MATIADTQFPCLDCKLIDRLCRQRDEIMRKVFYAIGNGDQVSCEAHEEDNFHGLDGVRP